MPPELSQPTDKGIDAELDSVTYSGLSAAEAVLYSDSRVPNSARVVHIKKEPGRQGIRSLNSVRGSLFVLHFSVGCAIKKAAGMVHTIDIEHRAHLQDAYLQLALSSLRFEPLFSAVLPGSGQGVGV